MTPASFIATMVLSVLSMAAAAPAAAQDLKTIALGNVSKTAVNWPAFVAEEKGFFRQHGVAPQVIYVGNVANTVQQLVGGTFDVAISTFDTAVRAIVKGGGATMIGGMTVKYPYNVMVAPNVRTAADL